MAYANFLTLPSAFPRREPEHLRRAWIARSLICLGLCLVFIATVYLASIGPFRHHNMAGDHAYLESRQVPSAEPRGGPVEEVTQQMMPQKLQPTTLFLTAGWDDSEQSHGLMSNDASALQSKVIELGSAVSTSPLRQITSHPDYPSLNPSIGAQDAHGQGKGSDKAEAIELTALSARASAKPTHGSQEAGPVDLGDMTGGPQSSPMMSIAFLQPAIPSAANRPAVPSIDPNGDSSVEPGSREQQQPQSDAVAYAFATSQEHNGIGSPGVSIPNVPALWDGPLPQGWDSDHSLALQPLIPQSGSAQGSPTANVVSDQNQQCPPCPSCSPCPPQSAPEEIEPANGPCSGQGFRCDECLNGWFCPPRETPAQVLPCGLGWPCFHCISGSFCIPNTAPEVPLHQEEVPPTPHPAPAPVPQPASDPHHGSASQALVPTSYAAPSPMDDQLQPTPDNNEHQVGSGAASQPASLGPLWNYVGCFQDDVVRALVGAQPLDYLRGDMSPLICVAHCEALGLPMAGVENGEECWCGMTIRKDTVRLPESCCEMACQSNPDATCGGEWAVGVFLKAGQDVAVSPQGYSHLI